MIRYLAFSSRVSRPGIRKYHSGSVDGVDKQKLVGKPKQPGGNECRKSISHFVIPLRSVFYNGNYNNMEIISKTGPRVLDPARCSWTTLCAYQHFLDAGMSAVMYGATILRAAKMLHGRLKQLDLDTRPCQIQPPPTRYSLDDEN